MLMNNQLCSVSSATRSVWKLPTLSVPLCVWPRGRRRREGQSVSKQTRSPKPRNNHRGSSAARGSALLIPQDDWSNHSRIQEETTEKYSILTWQREDLEFLFKHIYFEKSVILCMYTLTGKDWGQAEFYVTERVSNTNQQFCFISFKCRNKNGSCSSLGVKTRQLLTYSLIRY